MPLACRFIVVLAAVVMTFSNLRAAAAACDVVAAAENLRLAREAIDAACPCASALDQGAHVACARPVLAARVDAGSLASACKGTALKQAILSICGTPGAVVCCRVASDGKQSHKVMKAAAKCVDTSRYTTCISAFPSVPTGCDANGCVQPPLCGNGVVETGEDCEWPNNATCDNNCHPITCDLPVGCGNGTIDAGEQCDPPGVGSCGADCQTAPCAPPLAGEIAVACVDGAALVGAGSDGSGYLVSWSGRFRPGTAEVLARRLDATGAAVDAGPSVMSADGLCGTTNFAPAVGSDGSGYLVAWGEFRPPYTISLYARTFAGGGTLGTIDELASEELFGQGSQSIGGPMAVSSAAPATFAALWRRVALHNYPFQDPEGALLTYGATPTQASLALGYGLYSGVPGNYSATAASSAALGTDTLAVWHADAVATLSPLRPIPFVSAAWIDLDGTATQLSLGSRRSGINELGPGVAAGAASFLVAWAQGATDADVDPTEIRGLRVTRADGPLDVDGGVVLATTAGGVVHGGPVAAYDGTAWRVAWTESAVGGEDLRVVAVDANGIAGTPQLVASGLAHSDLAIASAGDGRALVMYVRPDGTSSAVRATLVPAP